MCEVKILQGSCGHLWWEIGLDKTLASLLPSMHIRVSDQYSGLGLMLLSLITFNLEYQPHH